MKKALFLGSLLFFVVGSPAARLEVPARAQTPASEEPVANFPNITQTAPPQIELLDRGIEPRQALRFQPPANSQQALKMLLDLEVTASFANGSMPAMSLPSSEFEGDFVVTRVDPNGDIHARFAYTRIDARASADVPPGFVEMMREQLQALVGMGGTFVMNDRGQVKSSDFNLPEDMNPVNQQMLQQMSNSLSQLSTPLPEEKLGVGAKWRATTAIDFGGIELTQSILYEVVSLQENTATLKMEVEQTAGSQALDNLGFPGGIKMSIDSLQSTGGGELNLRFDRAMPVAANLALKTDSEMSIQGNEEMPTTNISSTTLMQMRFEAN